jgi:hypothetical protein
MSNPSKAKGTSFEVSLLPVLQEKYPDASRRAAEGKNDKGDFNLPGEDRYVIEAKCRTQMSLPQWIREAEAEAKNAGVLYGVVISKRKGTADPNQQYVHMTVSTFLGLVKP